MATSYIYDFLKRQYCRAQFVQILETTMDFICAFDITIYRPPEIGHNIMAYTYYSDRYIENLFFL